MSDDVVDRVSSALKKTLDSHGYSFQYSVVRYCEVLCNRGQSRWRFEVAEFPVDVNGADTRIDFVLRGASQWTNVDVYLVCECKRPNPAVSHWAFVRAPYTRPNRQQPFTLFESVYKAEGSSRMLSVPVKLRDLKAPYDLAIELRGDAKGDPQGTGRGAVDEAASQVLRGVGGLIDFFRDNTGLLSR